MTTTLQILVIATFPLSGFALILSLVALGTDRWLEAYVDLSAVVGGSATDNLVNYGLFSGRYIRLVSNLVSYSLFITCDFGENKCAMLCGALDLRTQYLESLIQSNAVADGYAICRKTALSALDEVVLQNSTRADDSELKGYINCGVWMSTVFMLVLSCGFGITSSVLAILNTVSNPVETFLSIRGLFFYNCSAFVLSLLVLLLWGVHFTVDLSANAGIYDTIRTIGDSAEKANLGYSYWLVLGGLILYGCSIGVLIARYIIMRRQPTTIVNLEDRSENTIILY